MDNKFRRIIEYKKQKGSNRKPKYATRKLSIGLVSCMLGYALLVSPSSVEAAELDSEAQAVAEESADTETTSEEENAVEKKEETSTEGSVEEKTPAEGSVEEKTPAPAEEIEKLKEETPANSEAPEEKEEAVVEDKEVGKNKDNTAEDKLEFSEEKEFENQGAGENSTEEKAITNVDITIGGAKNGQNTKIVNPTALPGRTDKGNTDINLEARVDFDIPKGTKHGRTFDFVVSDNVNLHGVLVDEDKAVPVKYDNVEIATGTKLTDGRRGYRYTFNENVDNLENIRVRILYPLWIDPDAVPNDSENENIAVTVADKTVSKDYKIEYEKESSQLKEGKNTLSGMANIDEITSNSYDHTIYVNPKGDQGLINSNVTIENANGYNSALFQMAITLHYLMR